MTCYRDVVSDLDVKRAMAWGELKMLISIIKDMEKKLLNYPQSPFYGFLAHLRDQIPFAVLDFENAHEGMTGEEWDWENDRLDDDGPLNPYGVR